MRRRLARVVKWKVYIDRSRGYLGYMNFIMILFVFLESYKETAFGVWFYAHSLWTIPLAILLFVAIALIWGYIDVWYIRPHEQVLGSRTNELFMDMYKKNQEIWEKTVKNDD